MKKYLVLTSVLALAACGGGSGGGGGIVAPSRAAVTDGAVASNSAITGMTSEVLVAADGSATARSASLGLNRSGTVVQNGQAYTSYRLDDVKFRIAAGAVSDDSYVKFHMDNNGRIDSLKMNLNGEEQTMARKADGNNPSADFRGIVYEYVETDAASDDGNGNYTANERDTLVRLAYSPDNDITDYSVLQNAAAGQCPNGKVCRWDRIDQAMRITSKGKSENASENFKYSDFGIAQFTNFGKYKGITSNDDLLASKTQQRKMDNGVLVGGAYKTWDDLTSSDFDNDFEVFAGGYDVLSKRPTATMDFTGKAVGSLYATDSQYHADQGVELVDNAATLHFDTDTGEEKLTMNFTANTTPWYKVTVTKNLAAGTNNIAFSNYANTNNSHVMYDSADEYNNPIVADTGIAVKDYLKFKNDTGSGLSVDNFTTTTGTLVANTEGTKTEGLLNMGYYGINSTEEAAGVVRFKETYQEASNVQHEREFRAGYAMKPNAE